MVEHFRTKVECKNVRQLVANLGQSKGELARWYVDRVTTMQPDNKVFQVGMTTYLLSCLTNGALNEFRWKLKYEEPTTMAQVQDIAQKVDKVLSDFIHLLILILIHQLDLPTNHPLHIPNRPIKVFLHLQCNLNSNSLFPKLLLPNLVPKLPYFPSLPIRHSETQL